LLLSCNPERLLFAADDTMTLSRVTKWLGGIVIAGYLLTLLASHYTLNTLKVGGDIYNKIALGKDLVADILPPPAYLIEAYLEATLAIAALRERNDAADAAARVEKLKTLQKDYETRYQFWLQQELDPILKNTFLVESHQPGERFWRIIGEALVPAMAKRDGDALNGAYQKLSAAYAEHRAAIDKTVSLANTDNENILADAASQERVSVSVMWLLGLVVLLMVAGGAWGVLRVILKPMNGIKQAMSELAVGRNDRDIPYVSRKDEIGEMARAVDVFRLNAIEREHLEVAMEQSRRKDVERQEAMDRNLEIFKNAISRNLGLLMEEVAGLRTTSEGLLKAAERARVEAGLSTQACSTAAAGSQAVAAATDQLNTSIREIAVQANNTRTIVGETTDRARTTDEEVGRLTAAVNEIETVVTLIRQIAQNTNLLALNATIESARAGEAGKGFAVVASEVKTLSEETAKATDDIAQQIRDVQATSDAAATSVRAIGAQVGNIHDLASSVAAAVEQQQHATADIARNVGIVATGSNKAAESARIVTEVAEKTGSEAQRLSTASDQLQAVSSAVSQAVQDFIRAVSADIVDRRDTFRRSVHKTITVIRNGERFILGTINVSSTGLKLSGSSGLREGDLVEVDLLYQATRARVIWADGEACGLTFVEPVDIERFLAMAPERDDRMAA
jgi:methyl-accepting chemotaxis protein